MRAEVYTSILDHIAVSENLLTRLEDMPITTAKIKQDIIEAQSWKRFIEDTTKSVITRDLQKFKNEILFCFCNSADKTHFKIEEEQFININGIELYINATCTGHLAGVNYDDDLQRDRHFDESYEITVNTVEFSIEGSENIIDVPVEVTEAIKAEVIKTAEVIS